MAQIDDVVDHGLEVLKKSAYIPDDTKKTRYALRTSSTGTFTPTGLKTAFKVTTMEIGVTPVALPVTALSGRNSMEVHNLDTARRVYIGNSNVTADAVVGTTSGKELDASSFWSVDVTDQIILYGIVASGTALVKITEVA